MSLEKAGADGYTGAVVSSEDRYMTIIVTGAAGFIGYHVCEALLARGERVVGVDNLNDYYDPALKQARLDRLTGRNGFSFHKLDFAERERFFELFDSEAEMDRMIHLKRPLRVSRLKSLQAMAWGKRLLRLPRPPAAQSTAGERPPLAR